MNGKLSLSQLSLKSSGLVTLALLAAGLLVAPSALAAPAARGVKVVADEANRRVDITIDGAPFTSYIWPTSLKKPVLYPIVDADGITVTRGYPLDLRPGERVDHPHHAGLWFNYENVNGFDFWNNSGAIKPEQRSKMGSILQTRIVSTKSGADLGELVVESVWVTGDNKQILNQTTRYVFMRRDHARVIDEVITLKALDHVVFKDAKDGLLGLRVASWLESPEEKGGIFMDASGNPTKVDAAPVGVPNPATGEYLTSEGIRGNAVAPGLIETNFHAENGDPDRPRRMASAIPMQRPGQPKEIAEAVVWLLSPMASYVTGTILEAGGGR